MAVVLGNGQHLGSHVLGQVLGQARAVGRDHLGHAHDLGGGGGGFGGIGTGNQHVHIAAGAGERRRDGVEGRRLDGGVVVFCDDEDGHDLLFLDLFTRLRTMCNT